MPDTGPPPAAITAAERTLTGLLDPWLSFAVHGTQLRTQMRLAATLALRDAGPHIAAAELDSEQNLLLVSRARAEAFEVGRQHGIDGERERLAAAEPCPLCGCDLKCAGCYCHEDPADKSYKAGGADEREAICSRLAERALDRKWAADLHAGGKRQADAIADLLEDTP